MMQSCRKMTRQISQEQEHPLQGWAWLALRFHLLICHACRSYARQLRWLRQTARQTHLDAAGRERIHDTLSTVPTSEAGKLEP
ncbi:MAG: anti-sigma factor family protein [Gammaproteobacteria bacterium]